MKYIFYLLIFSISFFITQAQNVGIGTTTPHASAILDVTSTNKGVLIPRVSSLPLNPATGLLVYYLNKFYYYNGTEWLPVGEKSEAAIQYLSPKDNYPTTVDANDSLGVSIASGNNYFIVGAPGAEHGAAVKAGAVYTAFFLENTNRLVWNKAGISAAVAPLAGDGFGTSVAASGYDFAVGAPYRDMGGVDRGAVYAVNTTNNPPTFSILPAPTVLENNDLLGKSVALATSSAGAIVVGGASNDDGGYGAVHTWFKPSAGAYAYETRLIDGASISIENFGHAVDVTMDNDENAWLFVGAPFANAAGAATSKRGKVYIYKRNVTTNIWTLHQSLLGTEDGGRFGYSLSHAKSGTRQVLAIGQPGETFIPGGSPGGSSFSQVHIYSFDTTANLWVSSATINPSNYNNGGESVSVVYDGSVPYLLTGHSKGLAGGSITTPFGVANYYYRNGAVWTLKQKYIDIDGNTGYDFGRAVFINSARQILIGSSSAPIDGDVQHGKITAIDGDF
ncbi:FG-GAP repeat protein [Ferruginibacter sp. SUN002]|uniref:FG-GAP repeat protein n=1 Tax=Ferruginibacter sp. SUN002 TaxID=2937789 RepID=UPI003D369CCF